MNSNPIARFKELFIDTCGETVSGFGFKFKEGYSRPRGIALEFIHNKRQLFAVQEEGVVIMDLILQESSEKYWRVSLNQALWFSGVKSVAEKMPPGEKLKLFTKEIKRCCGKLLNGDLSAQDERYCFPMSSNDYKMYLKFQRGK